MSNLLDYTCPRCSYKTRIKNDMRKHLYNRKKSCPGQTNQIVLTDEIRERVLENRVYDIKKESASEKCTLNLNNFVIGMDQHDKIDSILTFEDKKMLNLGDKIELNNSYKIKKLDDRSYKYGFQLDHNDFLELIDKTMEMSSNIEIERMNLLYITELNKIAIFHDDEWKNYLFDIGLNKVISILINYYLVSYEKYMLYKIFVDKTVGAMECNAYKNQLNEYLKFLIVFDIYPSCKEQTNEEYLSSFKHEKDLFLSDFCMNRYHEQKILLNKSEIAKIRKHVGDIIKTNNGANIRLLNKYIINLAVNDELFKDHLLCYSSAQLATKITY